MTATPENDFDKIAAGNQLVFERVFHENFRNLCLYANYRVKDTEAAREIVQDLFCNLWEKRTEIQIHTSINSYLYRAVHNAALNYLKHQKVKDRSRQFFLQQSGSAQFGSEEELEAVDLSEAINKAVADLPEKTRQIFEQVRFHDKKYREVAEELQISQKTVEAHMTSALKILRASLHHLLTIGMFFLFIMHRVNQ